MKPPSLLIVLLLLLTLLAPAGLRADINGFKGMRWGSNLADLQQTKKLALTKEGGKGTPSLYVLENEELRFGKAALTGIHCSFVKERLQGVILLFSGANNFAAVKNEAFAKFGTSKKIDQGGEEMYNWPGTTTSVVLSYNRKNQSGFLFMKAKKMPPPAKKAEQRKPMPPPPQETAPDKTPPVAAPSFQPVPSPDDMETALDRAPPLPQQPDNAGAMTPEMQALIDRDQVLTQLCWETVGPAADAACVQMRENVERLKEMGLCMQPGSAADSADSAVIWYRCGPGATVAPPAAAVPPGSQGEAGPSVPPVDPAGQQQTIAPPETSQAGEDKVQRCRRVGELFAAAARMRDNGTTPQAAEEELAWQVSSEAPEITIERIRETIELVYFDREYNTISGEALIQQVSDRCLSGRGPFLQPLP